MRKLLLLAFLACAGQASAATVRPLVNQGSAASDPGGSCQAGRWYFNTTDNIYKYCINSAWAPCATGGRQGGANSTEVLTWLPTR